MTSTALAMARPLEEEQLANQPEIKSIFRYVGGDGAPVAMPMLESARVLEVEGGSIDKVKVLLRSGEMSLGLHDGLLGSLEKTGEPFYIVQITSLSDSYLNDPKTPHPERAKRLMLAPK